MMENVGPVEGQDRIVMSKKLRSPVGGENNTMDSFQDGGQHIMNPEQSEFASPMEGSRMKPEMNNYPPSSREAMMGSDNYRINPGMHPNQMQGYNPYMRENYDQHGGMPTGMSAGMDFPMQNAGFQGQYSQSMRPGHPGLMKSSGPMPGSYGQRGMISGQNISQQSGPTPTLNQLLQNPNVPPQRSQAGPGPYMDHPQKGSGDSGASMPYGNWDSSRQMGMFPQNPMGGGPPSYRNQNMPGDVNSQRFPPSPSYSMQQQQQTGQYTGGQFSPNSRLSGGGNRQGGINMSNQSFNNQMGPHYGQQQQQYISMGYGAGPPMYVPSSSSLPHHPPQSQQLNTQMSSGQPPGMTPPPGSRPSPSPISESPHQRQPSPMPSPHRQPSPSPSSRQHTPLSQSTMSPQQVPPPTSQQMPSPAGSNSSWSANNGTKKESEDGDSNTDVGGDDVGETSQGTPTSSGSQPPTVSSLRPVPSPVGSSGSRSNTPHSITGNQAGSPMPPRPPSQHDNQSSRMTQSPMATQGFNQQMMPPPVGPNQMPFGSGGGKMTGGNMPAPMGHYSQYNSHFPSQGNYPGRGAPGGMSSTPNMQNYPQQNMYNGPSQGHMGANSHMYNNMPMNRNPNMMYGGQNMPNQYGSFNGPMGPSQGPGPVQGGMNPGNPPGMDMSGYRSQGQGSIPSGPNGPVKGAQAAAHAALMAAASTSSRHGKNTPQKVHGPQSAQMNHSNFGPGMSNSGVPNPMNQLPNSHSPVPNSNGPSVNMPKSEAFHNNRSQDGYISQSNGPTHSVDSSVSSSTEIPSSKLPSTQSIPPSIQNMQRDTNSSSSSLSNTSVPSSDSNVNNSASMNMPPQSGPVDSTKDTNRTSTPPCSTPNARPESHGADSNLSSLTEDSSQGDVSSSNINEQKDVDMPSMPEQGSLPPNSKQDLPITTTATTHNTDTNIVTQSITSPVTSITESGNSNDSHPEHHIPHQQNCLPPVQMPTVEEQVPEKGKKKKAGGDVSKLYEMGNEPERRFFLDRLLSFLDERNAPLHNMPSISKQPLDLYRLYLCVREKGGMMEVTKTKKWKEICGLINIGSSASAAFTLKKNYIKYLFHYECQFDRNGMDPQPILAQMEATLEQKRERKNRRAPSPGSQGSQDAFRPPSNQNNNSQGMDGFQMGPGYMQNQDPNMGPMPGMMQHGGMMNNMMPNNSMPGMQHNNMMGGMPNMHPGMMGGNSYMMGGHNQNMMGNNMGMPHNMMANNMGMPGNNMGMQPSGNNMGMPPGGNSMNMPPSGNMGMSPAGNNMGMPGSNMRGPGNMQRMPCSSGMPGNSIPPGNNMPPSSMPPGGNMPPSNMLPGNNVPPNSMALGNNMPPSGNIPPNAMPPTGNMPPNSMGNLPVNSDSVSCQDPFADEQPNSGYPRQGQNFSGMSPQQNINSNSGFNRPSVPPSMSKTASMGGMSQSLPPTSMASNSSFGPQGLPQNSMGQNVPPNSMGQVMPPNSVGQNMPPNSTSQMPQSSVGQNMPPNSVQSMPPSSMSQTPNSMEQNVPPTTMNQNPALSEDSMNINQSSQDSQDLPFSTYQKSEDSNMSNSQSLDTMNSSVPFSNTNTMSSSGRQFPFGDQFSGKPERFDSPNSMQMQASTPAATPPPQRYPTPQSSQALPSQPSVDSNMPRYSNQPPHMMPMQQGPPHGMDNSMNDPYRPPPGFQNPQYQTPNKGMMGHDQYPNYMPNQSQFQRTPMRDSQGMYSTPNKRYPEPYSQAGSNMSSGYNTPQSGYNYQSSYSSPSGFYNQSAYGDRPSPGPAQYPYQKDNMSSSYDPHMQDGHMNTQWSPMHPRWGGMTPSSSLPPHLTPPHRRMSPTRDHKSGVKGMMPGPYPQKKDIPFPPESVEAIAPNYVKRRRLTRADVGPIEAWRMMMALKSGLLAESTWALDTLNILLFDDSSISFFNLTHLPGLLEALLEHYRKCLISIFGETFDEIEKMSDQLYDSNCQDYSDISVDISVKSGANIEETNKEDYTWVSRRGKEVLVEEDTNGISPLESKSWDIHSGASYKYGHWQLGGGDLTTHVVPFFGSKDENLKYKSLFIRPPMKLKDEYENSDITGVKEEVITESDLANEGKDVASKDETREKDDSHQNNSEHEENEIDIKSEDIPPLKNHVMKKVTVKQEQIEEALNFSASKVKSESFIGESDIKKEVVEEEQSTVTDEEHIELKSEEIMPELQIKSEPVLKMEDIHSVVQTKGDAPSVKRKAETEDESYQRDEPPLRTVTEANDELGRRCVCISNIFRSLSSVPSNHTELSKHPGLMYTLGKLLLLNHRHLPRNTTRKKFDRDDSEIEDIVDSHLQQNDEEWWWEYFTQLRENTFVIFANICGHLQLKFYPEEVCLPILDGLLHWAVCPSSCATDPFPSSPASVLSPQRLVLEALCKLCIHETNVDLLLATPPYDRIVQLIGNLVKLLANRSDPVMVEFAIVLLSELVQGDSSAARAIAIQHPSISLLLDFLETAEGKAMQVANHHGISALRDNPEAMGTSLDMLRRTASILLHLAQVSENRPLFGHHQQRILSLVMSQILDQYVAQILSDVLYQCFQDKEEEELVS